MNLVSFENAISRLNEGLERYERDPNDAQIRDGLIQRFEFTYELAHKTIRRYLESISATPGIVDAMPFADQIRAASMAGILLNDWPSWRGYRDMRARTSHTYDEAIALQVVSGMPAFLLEAGHLRDVLRQHPSA